MKIEKGPFAGIDIPDSDLTYYPSNDGGSVPFWPTQARTPYFLETFSPLEGWTVIIENHQGPFNLPDTRDPMIALPDVLTQPTQLFIAKLVKDGVVYEQASSLAIIDAPSAWERGETAARGRLYEATGLPGFLRQFTPLADSPGTPTRVPTGPQPTAVIPMTVTPVQTTDSSRNQRYEEANETSVPEPSEAPHQETTAAAETSTEGSPAPAAQPEVLPEAATVLRHPKAQPGQGTSNIAKSVNENLREQILHMATARSVEIPVITTNAEAKAFYKQLLKDSIPTEQAS